jgi:hypothetical protein
MDQYVNLFFYHIPNAHVNLYINLYAHRILHVPLTMQVLCFVIKKVLHAALVSKETNYSVKRDLASPMFHDKCAACRLYSRSLLPL